MHREAPGPRMEPPRSPSPRRAFHVGALLLAALVSFVIIAWWRAPEDQASARDRGGAGEGPSLASVFPQWKKPDLVLLLSGQQHGYLQPCGCSKPQFGGLTRRYNLLRLLQRNGWPVVALDLGDVPQHAGLQTMLKYVTSMKALTLMDYQAVGIGENELALPLLNALGNYRLNHPSPKVLAANLAERETGQTYNGLVDAFTIVKGKGQVSVGVIGLVGTSVSGLKRDPAAKFLPNNRVLPKLVGQVAAQKPDLLVLLYQGSLAEAKVLAQAVPNFDVILCLSAEEEPPSLPEKVGKTRIINVGHKGRYVGVVGAYRTGQKDRPFELRYQLVALGEEFDTPKGQEANHPVMKLLEDYTRQVKRDNLLARAAMQQVAHPLQVAFPQSTYVGSQTCKQCHGKAYKIWAASPHAHAYASLEKAEHPSLRQFDGECVKCHVTGWGYKGGFTPAKVPLLVNNGCENCHGPGSEHVRLEKKAGDLTREEEAAEKKIRDLMNPYRFDPKESKLHRTRRLNLIGYSCQKCHDIENDVKWDPDKWWKIVHSADHK